ncbi:MAG: TetR/AcrR family transcriptional regulator [Caldilineaceae bacterium]
MGVSKERTSKERIVKEYTVRRTEILDAAQRLVQIKGYEQMTIQDILDELKISKGAFYHYFSAKQDLLEALIERFQVQAEQIVVAIVQEPHRPALEKLVRLFTTLSRWKTTQKEFFLALLRVWYADDNALIRHKTRLATVKLVTPYLQIIIEQGLQEGVLTTAYPAQVGAVVLGLLNDLGDAVVPHFLTLDQTPDPLAAIEQTIVVYTDAIERVLGAPPGSLPLIDAQVLRLWVDALREQTQQPHPNPPQGEGTV